MEKDVTLKAIAELNYIPAMMFIFDNASINKVFSYVGKDSFVMEKDRKNDSVKQIEGKNPKEELEKFKKSKDKYDLVLIDEDLENRWKWINEAFSKTSIILVHDTENYRCDWSLVKKPRNFIWLDIKTYNPWTSIITSNKDIVSKAVSKLNASIRT